MRIAVGQHAAQVKLIAAAAQIIKRSLKAVTVAATVAAAVVISIKHCFRLLSIGEGNGQIGLADATAGVQDACRGDAGQVVKVVQHSFGRFATQVAAHGQRRGKGLRFAVSKARLVIDLYLSQFA